MINENGLDKLLMLLERIDEKEREEQVELSPQDKAILELTNEINRIAIGLRNAELSIRSRLKMLSDENSALKADIIQLKGQIAHLDKNVERALKNQKK